MKLVLAALYFIGAVYVCFNQETWRTLAGNIPLLSPLLKAAMEHALFAYLLVGAAVLLMLLVDILCEKQPDLRKKLAVSPLYVRWTLLMGLMFLTLIFGCYGAGFDRTAFLYAGF